MTLAAYLLAAILAWTRVPTDCGAKPATCAAWEKINAESPGDARARYEEIAQQVADEAEKRGGTKWRQWRTALELVAIAFEETGFASLVDDGSCNSPYTQEPATSMIRALGGCDHGRAWTVWQLHPDLTTDVQHGIQGPDLVADRTLAIHVAWDLRLVRPMAWTVWQMAARRAAAWMRGHPFDGQAR